MRITQIFQFIIVFLLIQSITAKSTKKWREKVDQSVKLTSTMSLVTDDIKQKLTLANDKLHQASLGQIQAEKTLLTAIKEQTEASQNLVQADNEFQQIINEALNASKIQLDLYNKLFTQINDQKKKRTKSQVELDTFALNSALTAQNAWQNLVQANQSFQEAQKSLNSIKADCERAQINLYSLYGGLTAVQNEDQQKQQEDTQQLKEQAKQNYINSQQQYQEAISNLQKAQQSLVEASNSAILKQKEADIAAEQANNHIDDKSHKKSKKESKKKYFKQKI
ncbi:hypothetical protein ABPG74_010183 [Tetrahymena malaccensis]